MASLRLNIRYFSSGKLLATEYNFAARAKRSLLTSSIHLSLSVEPIADVAGITFTSNQHSSGFFFCYAFIEKYAFVLLGLFTMTLLNITSNWSTKVVVQSEILTRFPAMALAPAGSVIRTFAIILKSSRNPSNGIFGNLIVEFPLVVYV